MYALKQINEAIRSDPAAFARECDALFAKKVEAAAQKIADHRAQSHIILLSGPSGSGKTTTALKIEERLVEMGIETHTISLDNYFKTFDPDTAPPESGRGCGLRVSLLPGHRPAEPAFCHAGPWGADSRSQV